MNNYLNENIDDCRYSYLLKYNGNDVAIFDNVSDVVRYLKHEYSTSVSVNMITERLRGNIENQTFLAFQVEIVTDYKSRRKLGIKLK